MRGFAEYIASLVWERGNLDTSAYLSFLRAASLKVDDEQSAGGVGDAGPGNAPPVQLRGGDSSQHQRRLRNHEPFSPRVAEPVVTTQCSSPSSKLAVDKLNRARGRRGQHR
jgi:hypothetical protein